MIDFFLKWTTTAKILSHDTNKEEEEEEGGDRDRDRERKIQENQPITLQKEQEEEEESSSSHPLLLAGGDIETTGGIEEGGSIVTASLAGTNRRRIKSMGLGQVVRCQSLIRGYLARSRYQRIGK